jgi:hypothetical protein
MYDEKAKYGLPEGESYQGRHLVWHPKLPAIAKGICRGKGLPCPPKGYIEQGKMYPIASMQYGLAIFAEFDRITTHLAPSRRAKADGEYRE